MKGLINKFLFREDHKNLCTLNSNQPIKCNYFGKSLKRLFTILLTSSSFLLVNFSNGAYFHNVGTMFDSDYDGAYKIGLTRVGQFRTVWIGTMKRVFMPSEDTLLLFDNGMPYIRVHKNGSNYSPTGQGYLKYIDLCGVMNPGQLNYPNDCVKYYSYTGDLIPNFMGTLSNTDILWYDIEDGVAGNTPYKSLRVCVSNASYGKTLCFGGGTNNYCTSNRPYQCNNENGTLFGSSINYSNLNGQDLTTYQPTVDYSNFNSSSDTDYGKTNQSVYDSYLNFGFYKRLCYSDFYTGTLIYDDNTFNQFFNYDTDDSSPYSGATVFDYKAIVYPRRPNEQRGKNFYNLFEMSYKNNDLTNWIGRPTGLRQIMRKIYNGEFNTNFNFTDYFTFCNMAVNGFQPNALFTGDTSEVFDNYYDSNTNVIVNFGSGAYSGEKDMFSAWTKITGLFHDNLMNTDLGNKQPILPAYIVVGFLAMLLIYGLKR